MVPTERIDGPTSDGAGRVVAWMKVSSALGDPSDGGVAAAAPLLARLPVRRPAHRLGLGVLPFGADEAAREAAFCASLDHTIWFHGQLSADRWHLYDFTCVHYVGGRGLAIGHVFADDGAHVATVAQEVLVRDGRERRLNGRRGSTVGDVAHRSDLPPLSPTLERLRAHVLEHSVKHGTFTLKSGATSSWFLDTKQTACRADGIVAVADALIEVFGDDFARIDAIGGLTMGSRSGGLRRGGGGGDPRPPPAQLQRPQGGQAGRDHRDGSPAR